MRYTPREVTARWEGESDASRGGLCCDEFDAAVNPGADEICDGVNNNCDGRVDVDVEDAELVYEDDDDDGFGNSAAAQRSCDPGPTYTAAVGGDCDDTDPKIGDCSEKGACGCGVNGNPVGGWVLMLGLVLGLRRR